MTRKLPKRTWIRVVKKDMIFNSVIEYMVFTRADWKKWIQTADPENFG